MLRPYKFPPIFFYGVLGLLLLGFILSRAFREIEPSEPEFSISSSEAIHHEGSFAEVCGPVASTSYREDIDGMPTFLNFDNPYPDQLFTVLIWGENRHRWHKPPELLYRNQEVCATGRIKIFQGDPEIIVENPAQLSIITTY